MPPGPPVLATLLAEVYGPDAASRRDAGHEGARGLRSVDFVVDVDDSYRQAARPRLRFSIDQEALEFHGVEQQAVYDTIGALVGGVKVGYSQRGGGLSRSTINVDAAEERAVARRTHPVDAAACRRHRRGRAPMSSLATS